MNDDRRTLAKEIVTTHVPPTMARVVLDLIDETTTTPPPADDPLLSVQQVAEMFGGIHTSSVYRMLDRGELAETRIGALRKVRRSIALAYLADNEHLAPRPQRKPRTVRRDADEQRVVSEHPWLEAI